MAKGLKRNQPVTEESVELTTPSIPDTKVELPTLKNVAELKNTKEPALPMQNYVAVHYLGEQTQVTNILATSIESAMAQAKEIFKTTSRSRIKVTVA